MALFTCEDFNTFQQGIHGQTDKGACGSYNAEFLYEANP